MKILMLNGKPIRVKNPHVVRTEGQLNIYDGNDLIGEVWRPKSWLIFDDEGKVESQPMLKVTDPEILRDARLLNIARLNNLIARMLMTEIGRLDG